MAIRVIDDSKLNDIAVAIQTKDSGGQMTVDEMPTRIANIPSGGATLIPKTITENGVYNATDDNADGYDVVTVGVPQDQNKNLDDYIQGDLIDIVFNGTVVANGTFRGTNIISISMPNVITIGPNAFAQTSLLSSIVLPDSATKLGAQAFYSSNITSFALSPNITNIPQSCFQDSKKFTTLVLPKKLTSIINSAFANCTGLLTVDMSEVEGLATVMSNSFSNTTCTFLFRDQTQLDEYANATNWSALASRFQIKPNGVN